MTNEAEIERSFLIGDSLERLEELAHRAVHVLGNSPNVVSLVVIDVNDASWTALVEALMPNENWQAYRDRGEIPVARGSIYREVVEYICGCCPDIRQVLHKPAPLGYLYTFVLAAKGASVYLVPYEAVTDERNDDVLHNDESV